MPRHLMCVAFRVFEVWEAHRRRIHGRIFRHLIVGTLQGLSLVALFHGYGAGIDPQFLLMKTAARSTSMEMVRTSTLLYFGGALLRCLYITYKNFETVR